MANPITAKRIGLIIDPKDRDFFAFTISQGEADGDILQPDEAPVTIALEVAAPAASVGLSILSGTKAPVIEGRNVLFWCEIASAFWSHAVFDAAGTDLPIEVTILTSLDRRKQFTILIGASQK